MQKLARKQGSPELQASVEPVIPALGCAAEKLGPDRYLQRSCPIINSPSAGSALPRRGLNSVTFLCPSCLSTDLFGSIGGTRLGRCNRCPFEWPRIADWRVFVDAATGKGFRDLEEFEAQVGTVVDFRVTP